MNVLLSPLFQMSYDSCEEVSNQSFCEIQLEDSDREGHFFLLCRFSGDNGADGITVTLTDSLHGAAWTGSGEAHVLTPSDGHTSKFLRTPDMGSVGKKWVFPCKV